MELSARYCPCGGNVHPPAYSHSLTASDEASKERPVRICENCGYIFCEKCVEQSPSRSDCPFCGSFATGGSFPILLDAMFVSPKVCGTKAFASLAGPSQAEKCPSGSLFGAYARGESQIRIGNLETTVAEQRLGVLPHSGQRAKAESAREFLIENVRSTRHRHALIDDDKDFFGATVDQIDSMLDQRGSALDSIEVVAAPSRRGVLIESLVDMEDLEQEEELPNDEPVGI